MAGIKALREQRGLSLSELARQCGAHAPNVFAWERNIQGVSYRNQKRLYEIFGEIPDECHELLDARRFRYL